MTPTPEQLRDHMINVTLLEHSSAIVVLARELVRVEQGMALEVPDDLEALSSA